MKRNDSSADKGWRIIHFGGLAVAIAMLLVGPPTVGAEPAVTDVAKDVAVLAARVQDLERSEMMVLGLLGVSVLGMPVLWWRMGKRISRLEAAREKR